MKDVTKFFESSMTRRTYKKRSIVLYQGEVPRHVYVVLKGVIKVYALTNAGEEQVVALLTKNDIFSLPWLFGSTNHALYYHEALTDCVLSCVDKEVFMSTMQKNQELQTTMLSSLARLYSGSLVHITALEQSRAREKVLTVLYYLCLGNGTEFKPGKYKITLHLTHSIIASLCGLTRETAALELSKLKKSGVVKYTARYYLIDKAGIEKLLGEDNFANVKLQ